MALQKTLSLLLLIGLGFLLKQKFLKEEQKNGLKIIILDIALPAMIFVALLKIEVQADLLVLPVAALLFNVFMLLFSCYVLPFFGVAPRTAEMRTLMLLLPSLAPGLSCFPFLAEYLGDEYLAWGALADIGNKLFVLVIAYLLAMKWFYGTHQLQAQSNGEKVKSLLFAMLKEPINLVIVTALILLGFGLNLERLPVYLGDAVLMMKNMMTPLVLLFIGVAVVFKWAQIRMIASLLTLRAGVTFLLSGLIVLFVPLPSEAALLFVVVFPQSACSFWPFAHMSAVRALEREQHPDSKRQTFDLTLGINVLAVSLPFSTLLIMAVFTSGGLFVQPWVLLGTGVAFMLLAAMPLLLKWLGHVTWRSEEVLAEKVK
ncbi:MAG: AEC family transporter [Nitritalea sp.]